MRMYFSKIIGLISAAAAVYFYTKTEEQEDQLEREREDHETYVNQLLEDNQKLEDTVNPNGSAEQAPVVFTATVRQGGVTLNQTEIILNCTNTANYAVEIGDFQAYLWLANVRSLKCIPANISAITIQANQTVSFRLYSREGIIIQDYVDCKKRLNMLFDGKNSSFMRANTYIPQTKTPVQLDMQYIWYGKNFEEKCYVYDVPGSYRWKYSSWVHGTNAGYNAADKKQQEKNPSDWVDQSGLDD